MLHRRYFDIVAKVTEDIEQWLWSEEDPSELEKKVNRFKKMSVETSNDYCNFCPYTLNYHLPYRMVE